MRQWGSRSSGAGRAGSFVLVALLAVLLSGCLKLDAVLTVNADDTITGDYVVAYKKDPNRPAVGFGTVRELLVTSGTATASRYDDGEYEGTRYRLDAVPLADLARFLPVTYERRQTGTIRITRDGSDFVVTGTFDFRETRPTARTPEQQRQAEELFSVRVRLTFPGTVQSGNGTVEGSSVTWQMRPFTITTLQARASAIAPPAPAAARTSLGPVVLGAGAGLGAILLLLALLSVLRERRRRRSGPAEPAEDTSADPTDFSWVVGDRPPARVQAEPSWTLAPDPRYGAGLGGSAPPTGPRDAPGPAPVPGQGWGAPGLAPGPAMSRRPGEPEPPGAHPQVPGGAGASGPGTSGYAPPGPFRPGLPGAAAAPAPRPEPPSAPPEWEPPGGRPVTGPARPPVEEDGEQPAVTAGDPPGDPPPWRQGPAAGGY